MFDCWGIQGELQYPTRDEFLSKTKTKTSSNGLICYFKCKTSHCNYFLRCYEDKSSNPVVNMFKTKKNSHPQTRPYEGTKIDCWSLYLYGYTRRQIHSYRVHFLQRWALQKWTTSGAHSQLSPHRSLCRPHRVQGKWSHRWSHSREVEGFHRKPLSYVTPDDDKVECIHQVYEVECLSFRVFSSSLRIIKDIYLFPLHK